MREIILDTETTGLDPVTGDRIVEIAALELINGCLTDNSFHTYVNPERDMQDSAFKVHGLSFEFLRNKPKFEMIVEGFMQFISNATIIAHNADFDIRFINAELARLGREGIDKSFVVDTLIMARRKHPGVSNSLDALCVRYGINRSKRVKHGALIDCEILADVYIELQGGRQKALELATLREVRKVVARSGLLQRTEAFGSFLALDEVSAHGAFLGAYGDLSLWSKYWEKGESDVAPWG